MTRSTTRYAVASVIGAAAIVNAIVTPNLPYGGVVDTTGQPCALGWALDTTGAWNNMNIELMTGDNQNFVHLAWVAKGVDGTTGAGTYSWTCPDVTINAPIYFYQYTQTGQQATYTTRFTIAAADGTTEAAPNATQPGGQAIPWGTGAIVGGSPDNSSSGAAGASSSSSSSSSGAASPQSTVTSTASSSSGASSAAGAATSGSTDSSASSSADSASTTVVTVQPSTTRRLSSASQATDASSASSGGAGSASNSSSGSSSSTGGAMSNRQGSVAGVGLVLALLAGLALA